MSEELAKIRDDLMKEINIHYSAGERTNAASISIALQHIDSAIVRVRKLYEFQLEACRKELKAAQERGNYFDDLHDRYTEALEALEKFESEDFYWAKKPFRDESGKEQPGYIKKVATLREFARDELAKIRGRE